MWKFNYKEESPRPQLLPNLDYKADQFRDFYELESDNFDAEQQKLAQKEKTDQARIQSQEDIAQLRANVNLSKQKQ